MLVQETFLISMSPCKGDIFEANDIEPDNEELLDFLTHLVDEDALDPFQAPGHPCSAPIADFSCTRHMKKPQYALTSVVVLRDASHRSYCGRR